MVESSNKLLKVRDKPALKGCIGSISAFEFEMYISSKMPHHVDIGAVNYTSLRHFYKLCLAVLSYQVNFACADLYTCRIQMTGKTDNRPEYRTPIALNTEGHVEDSSCTCLRSLLLLLHAPALMINFLLLCGCLLCWGCLLFRGWGLLL
jgi:hypothetical protein